MDMMMSFSFVLGAHEDRDRLAVTVTDIVTATHTVDVTIIVTVALTRTAKRIEGTRASVAVEWQHEPSARSGQARSGSPGRP